MNNHFMEYSYDKFEFKVDKRCWYHDSEFWVREESGLFIVGATDFLQTNAGDVAFLELPEAGMDVTAGDEVGLMETIKTTVVIVAPLSGNIKRVNQVLEDEPGLVNSDAYGDGWIMMIEATNWEAEKADLIDAEAYYPIMEKNIKQAMDKK